MKRYLLMPEGQKWKEVMGYTAQGVYSMECMWYSPETKIAVYDPVTGITEIFSRKLDENGNLIEITREVM